MKTLHASDCATHNEPAYPNGPCDCDHNEVFEQWWKEYSAGLQQYDIGKEEMLDAFKAGKHSTLPLLKKCRHWLLRESDKQPVFDVIKEIDSIL